MENASYPHTLWEERILKKQNQKGEKDGQSEKRRGHRKIFLAVFLIFFLIVIFYIVRVLFQDKISILGSVFSTLRNFSVSNISKDGKIQRFALGDEELVPMSILKYVPDGHISKIEKNGDITLFVSAHDKSYLMQGRTLKDMVLLAGMDGLPKPILKPDSGGFDKDYAGFGQVIENPETHDLIGIYHTEVRISPDASDSQLTSIALALSKDKGLTWHKMGRIITGQNTTNPGTAVSGTGQPAGVIVGDYIYLYFSDWNRLMPDSIHLARSLLSQNGMPGTWEKYTEQGFRQVGLGGKSVPVIVPFEWDRKIYYTANPSISFNEYLKKYLAIFETNIGFFAATSEDAIDWNSHKLIFEFPKDTTASKSIGDIWYSYPTLLSENTQTDMVTGKTGYLYYGRGIFGQDHQMVRRSFVIQ